MKLNRVDLTQQGPAVPLPVQAGDKEGVSSEVQPVPIPKIHSIQRSLKFGGWLGLGIARWSLYTSAIATALLYTTLGNRSINWGLKEAGMFPKVSNNRTEKDYKSVYNADRFFENFPAFNKIMDTVVEVGIDPRTLGKKNGIILSTQEEINALIMLLERKAKNEPTNTTRNKIEKTLILLKDFQQIDMFTWGPNGLDLDWLCNKSNLKEPMKILLKIISQQSAAKKSIDKDTQELRRSLKVTEYNLSKDNFDIKYIFDPGDEYPAMPLSISLTNLLQYENLDVKKLGDYPLVVPIANYIYDKAISGGMNIAQDALSQTSYPITLAENNDEHLIINTSVLTNDELDQILSKSKEKLIAGVGFSRLDKFVQFVKGIPSLSVKDSICSIDANNIHIVKDYDSKERNVTLLGLYGKATTLSLKEFRDEIPVIILDEHDAPFLNLKTILVLGLIPPIVLLTHINSKRLNRMLYPKT